ncbi:MAG TPA: thiolase domain-containing protein [Desulfurococcaceae archaeon]|nr:thiolase domain-containing protein [Desulfurococcaceae archaeon]
MRRVFVIGTGLTKIGEHWDKSLRDLLTEAILMAVDDASIALNDIEAVYVGNMSSGYLQSQEHLGSLVATWLGIPGIAACKVEAACASGGASFHQAYLAVASGLYDCVVASGVEKMTDAITSDVTSALIMADDQEYVAYIGATFVGLNALVYRHYMEKYNVKQEKIAAFSVHCHKYAKYNPYAQFRKEVTLEDVMSSPMIADPIHLLEAAPIGDGAAAIVLCSEDFVSKLKLNREVEVLASTMATDAFSLYDREDITTLKATRIAAEKAYKIAKISPEDINVLEVHDAFSILGVIHLEDLGFAKKGEGWKLVEEGELEVDGKIPTNLFGGLKARGHPIGATGIYQIVEVTWQLQGKAGKCQVDNAEIGLAQSVGGVGGTVVINILKRVG